MPCKFQILAENYAYKTQHAEWGFSVFIDFNGTQLLFDTGQSGDCVLKNAKFLNVPLENIEAIILSHGHYDHTGGLNKILKAIGNKKIFAHKEVFTKRFSQESASNQVRQDICVSFRESRDRNNSGWGGVLIVFRYWNRYRGRD